MSFPQMISFNQKCVSRCSIAVVSILLLLFMFESAFSQTFKVMAVSGKIIFQEKELKRNDVFEVPDLFTLQQGAQFSTKQDWLKLLNTSTNEILRIHAVETFAFSSDADKQHIRLSIRSENPLTQFAYDIALIPSWSLFKVQPKNISNINILKAYLAGNETYWLWGNDTLQFSDVRYPISEKQYFKLKNDMGKSTGRLSAQPGIIVISQKEIEQLSSGKENEKWNLIYVKKKKERTVVQEIQLMNLGAKISALKKTGLTPDEISDDLTRLYFSEAGKLSENHLSLIREQIKKIAANY